MAVTIDTGDSLKKRLCRKRVTFSCEIEMVDVGKDPDHLTLPCRGADDERTRTTGTNRENIINLRETGKKRGEKRATSQVWGGKGLEGFTALGLGTDTGLDGCPYTKDSKPEEKGKSRTDERPPEFPR